MISVKYDWQRDYIAAILETDKEKLGTRLAVAKAVMLSRVKLLNMNRDEARDERSSIAAAFCNLHKLRVKRLNRSLKIGP